MVREIVRIAAATTVSGLAVAGAFLPDLRAPQDSGQAGAISQEGMRRDPGIPPAPGSERGRSSGGQISDGQAASLLVGSNPVGSGPVGSGPVGRHPATATGSLLRDRAVFGVSVDGISTAPAQIAHDERLLSRRMDLVSLYSDWTHVIGGSQERVLTAGGSRTVLVSWEPHGISFADVFEGRQNGYLSEVAAAMRAYPGVLYVRPWPEMNALWSPWHPAKPGEPVSSGSAGTEDDFVRAWRYLVTYFHDRGVTNLKFVFNADASDFPTNSRIPDIWPGRGYVDVLAIDGFNWGESVRGADDTGDRWLDFTTIITPMYEVLTALHATAPVWITETGCKEPTVEDAADYPVESSPVDPAHSKAAWIARAFTTTQLPRIRAVVIFNKKKERDWRLDSSPQALAAIRQVVATGSFAAP